MKVRVFGPNHFLFEKFPKYQLARQPLFIATIAVLQANRNACFAQLKQNALHVKTTEERSFEFS